MGVLATYGIYMGIGYERLLLAPILLPLFLLLFLKILLKTQSTYPIGNLFLDSAIWLLGANFVLGLYDVYLASLFTVFLYGCAFVVVLWINIYSIYHKQPYSKILLIGNGLMIAGITTTILTIFGFLPFLPLLLSAGLWGMIAEAVVLAFILAYRIKEFQQNEIKQLEILRQKDHMIHQQNKMASIGEMIANSAHQWKQPLTVLNSTLGILWLKSKKQNLSSEYLQPKLFEMEQNIEYMNQTMRDFLSYSNPKKEKERFKLSLAISKALMIIEQSIKGKIAVANGNNGAKFTIYL